MRYSWIFGAIIWLNRIVFFKISRSINDLLRVCRHPNVNHLWEYNSWSSENFSYSDSLPFVCIAASVFPDDFLKNPHKRFRKNPYRLKIFRTLFQNGYQIKDFASTIEITHTFLNLTISNYFINSNHIFKCNSIPYTHTVK